MKKFVKTLIATILIATIVATPAYKVNSPTLNVGTTVQSNRNNSSSTNVQ